MSGNVSFPKQEEAILAYWTKIDAFHTQLKKSEAYGKEYVFYDGPPFATGLPHYGHILAGNIKDIVTRYLDLDTSPHDSPTPAQHSASHFSSIISCA